jgi:cytochrome c-type biogenesis protein CcmH/NrfG
MRTDTYKPWLLLGQSCEAMGQYLDAANAYREVIRLQPGVPDIFSKLANVLFKAGRIEGARYCADRRSRAFTHAQQKS